MVAGNQPGARATEQPERTSGGKEAVLSLVCSGGHVTVYIRQAHGITHWAL